MACALGKRRSILLSYEGSAGSIFNSEKNAREKQQALRNQTSESDQQEFPASMTETHIMGCILGAAIGDALGFLNDLWTNLRRSLARTETN